MGVRIIDNADDYVRGLTGSGLTRRTRSLSMVATMDYAVYLQDRHGYYVFSEDQIEESAVGAIVEVLEVGLPIDDRNLTNALLLAGEESEDFHTRYTSEMRPPVRAGQGWRAAHEGGWSDITNNLKNSIHFLVDGRRGP